MAYARIVHLGAGGVGKSSFQRGMMNLPLPDEANSTQMAELSTFQPGRGGASRDVSRHTAKAISGGGYWMPVTEDDETDELVGLVRLVYNVSSGKTTSSRVLELLSFAALYIHGAWSGNSARSEAQRIMDEIIELAKQNPGAQAPEFEVYLYVWDCGGQQVFQCILPAFLTSKSLFFLMFDARKDLHDRCLALTHHQGHASEQLLEQSTIELLLQWMSCIDATLTDKDSTPDASTKIPEYPRILPIGTHGDDPSVQDRKESILEQLYTEYQDKEYAHLVREKGVIIDNTTAGLGENADPGYKKVLHIVNDFANSSGMKVDTPLTWVLFRKVLHMMAKNKPYFTLKEVEEIAEACTIPEESVSSLLKFYHDLAVFLHYKKIPSLSSTVIADPQWLINQIAKLLALEGFETVRSPRLWGILRRRGILVETLYTEIWKAEEFSSHPSPQSIVDLLEHFLIVAPINTHGKVHNYMGREYFIPSVLPPLSTREGTSSASLSHERNPSTQNDASIVSTPYERKAASLHLIFPDIKYLPPGFFTRLATTLSKEEDYNIAFGHAHGIYRNRLSFTLGFYDSKIDTLIISECKNSVQIDLMRDESRKSGIPIFSNVCWKVIDTIRRHSTDIVCQWFPGMKTSYAFHCDCYNQIHNPKTPEPEPHFVLLKLEYTTDAVLRCQEDQVYRLSNDQKYWLRIAKVNNSGIAIN